MIKLEKKWDIKRDIGVVNFFTYVVANNINPIIPIRSELLVQCNNSITINAGGASNKHSSNNSRITTELYIGGNYNHNRSHSGKHNKMLKIKSYFLFEVLYLLYRYIIY